MFFQSLNNDRHLRIFNDEEQIKQFKAERENNDFEKFLLEQKQDNYGFNEVKILDGKVGYLDIRRFAHPDIGGDTAYSVMNFLSNTDALIIDLRNSLGGSPAMVQLLSSYLFNSAPVHLNTLYNRSEDQYSYKYTLPYVPGKLMENNNVYVLTSSTT